MFRETDLAAELGGSGPLGRVACGGAAIGVTRPARPTRSSPASVEENSRAAVLSDDEALASCPRPNPDFVVRRTTTRLGAGRAAAVRWAAGRGTSGSRATGDEDAGADAIRAATGLTAGRSARVTARSTATPPPMAAALAATTASLAGSAASTPVWSLVAVSTTRSCT